MGQSSPFPCSPPPLATCPGYVPGVTPVFYATCQGCPTLIDGERGRVKHIFVDVLFHLIHDTLTSIIKVTKNLNKVLEVFQGLFPKIVVCIKQIDYFLLFLLNKVILFYFIYLCYLYTLFLNFQVLNCIPKKCRMTKLTHNPLL